MREFTEKDLMVCTTSGPVHGFLGRGVPNWRGVPYARVERRFRPAVPVEPGGPIEATAWGPVSWQLPIQVSRGLYHLPLDDLVENEDCLNLNVWSPGPRPDGPLPVLVWLHGGSRVNGSASSWIDPWHFAARHGAVVITANYRLGPWGCLYLGGHDPDFAESANLEALDQVMLLRWIRDNIAGFGGDPSNVTLFGMSSGGCDVATLLGTPAAHGLFHRAAIYSGNAEVPMYEEAAVRFTDEFLAAAGPLAKSPEELTRLPNVGLRYIHGKLLERGISVRYRPFIDGTIIPRPPLDAGEVDVGTARSRVEHGGAKSTTMPKLPPPLPRSAQNRLESRVGEQCTTLPSARTTFAETKRSAPRPNLRVWLPIPPPERNPPGQTVGQVPAMICLLYGASAASASIEAAPGPMWTVEAPTDTWLSRDTSITRPGPVDQPSKLWPPLRTRTSTPFRRATRTHAWTSAMVSQ